MDKNEITEIICAAEKYLKELKILNNRIKRAEKQIIISGTESQSNIETLFTKLKDAVTNMLDVRKQQLITDIVKVQKNGIKPLQECQDVIVEKINKTNNLIEQGNDILKNSCESQKEKFYLNSSVIGNLPAVPSLDEVPYINFSYPEKIQQDILEKCSNIGTIFYHSPVNIYGLIPKPGSVLIQWEENDSVDDLMSNTHEFRLQFASGDIFQNPNVPLTYHDCYIGPNTEYLKRDLKLNQVYTFRVCCKLDSSSEWSPWSLPQIVQATVEPFTWNKNNEKTFSLNNDDKLATKIVKEPAVLFSSGPQLQPDYSVEFTFLEIDDTSSSCLVGLCDETDIQLLNTDTIFNLNTFIVNSDGTINVKNKEKSTRLPSMKAGSKISFTCEKVNEKVRIYVESAEKNVTYDWKLNDSDNMYFFTLSRSPNFKILVE